MLSTNMMILVAFIKERLRSSGPASLPWIKNRFVASYSLKKRESVKQCNGTRLTCARHLFNLNDITRQQSTISAVKDH